MYDSIVRFLRNGTYPPEDFNYRLHIRRSAKNYTLYGRRLCRGSQIVLHEEEAFIALRSFHSRKEHLRGPEFSAAVQKTYNVNRVKVLCFELVRCCANCSVTHTHYSVRQRKGLSEYWNPFSSGRRSHGCPRTRLFKVPPPYS